MTVKPLHERIYEEIFWEIGANVRSVELHSAKTAFFGTNKVDLVMHFLYINILSFLCYELSLQNDLNALEYWIFLGVLSLGALLNNFHGYFTMKTTDGTCNTKMYFACRTLIQAAEVYLSILLLIGRTIDL